MDELLVCLDGADLLAGLRVQGLDLSVARAHQDVAADAAGGVEAKTVYLGKDICLK